MRSGKDQVHRALNVRYQQFHQDVPVLGPRYRWWPTPGRRRSCKLRTRRSPTSPIPRRDRGPSPDVVERAALAPFKEGTKPLCRRARQPGLSAGHVQATAAGGGPSTASVELARKGKEASRRHARTLVHDLVVETSGAFEHFRVIVDAVGGNLFWIETAGGT
ncbi:hypothetical protein LV779_25575 [Streptomyces thinghirensis]|nr:hypothetical protein [Streptomyces thinghirensis]